MNKVAIMTDTASCMSSEVADRYNVELIPLNVSINGQTYTETEINLTEFYEKLPEWKEAGKPVTSSSAPMGIFLEAYRELSQKAEAILYISHSAKLGMSPNAALQAKARFQNELPQTTIEVIDSYTVCGGQMLVALEVARSAASGKSLSEVVRVADKMVKRVNYINLPYALSYLAEGGRIGRAHPWASSKITNTALLEMNAATGGEHAPLARCKTKGQTLKTLFDIVRKRSGGRKLHVAIDHAGVPAEAEELKEKALSQFPCTEVFINQIGPVVTIHNGVGTRVFSWWHED